MRDGVNMHRFHSQLALDIFKESPSESEVLCFMLLLHTCRISLSAVAYVEGGGTGFAPITARHAAEVVANIFRSDKEKCKADFWYMKWCDDWDGFELLEDLPKELIPGLQEVRNKIESHPWVDNLEDDDWDIIESLV